MALGLAMAGLARMTPQTDDEEHVSDEPESGARP
jgi:hypothetical protein